MTSIGRPYFVTKRNAVPAALWWFALRGVEEEAKDRETRARLRSHKEKIESPNIFADIVAAQGRRYTGEKMRGLRPRPAKSRRSAAAVATPAIDEQRMDAGANDGALTPSNRHAVMRLVMRRFPRQMSAEQIKAAADRAEARSRGK